MAHIYYIFALAIVVFSLLYYFLTSSYGYWERKLIPCLGGAIPGIGNVYPMLFMKRNMADMYRDFYNRMPEHSMFGFYNMREPALMVREPELVKTVLSRSLQNFAKNGAGIIDEELDPLLAFHPFFADEDRWKTSRQELSSAFTSGKLKYMYASANEARLKLKEYLNQLVKSSNGKCELELKDLFSRYTAEFVASVAFGVEGESFKSDKEGPFQRMARLWLEPSFVNGVTQIVMTFVPIFTKILRASFMPKKVDRFIREVAKGELKRREKHGLQRPDFLQLMIQYKKPGAVDYSLNEETITSYATTFFIDGYDTSRIVLSFVAYHLAGHPEVQNRAREEVTKVLAKHGDLTYEALQEMTYMDQVLSESLRLFPPFGTLIKCHTKEIELVGSDGLTCRVPPGTPIIIPMSALHRDPEYWPDPEKFDPERFSEENKHSRHKFAHFPFGAGARVCLGMRMGSMQIKAAVATILQSFALEVSPRTMEPIQLDPKYILSTAKGGLWVNLKCL